MRLFIPAGILTLVAVPLLAMNSEDTNPSEPSRAFSKTIEKSFSFSFGDEDHDHDHDHEDEDHHVIELDMGELTGGQVSGHMVLDIGHMMSEAHGRSRNSDSDVQISMIIEDEDGRRMMRHFGNGGPGGHGGMHGGHDGMHGMHGGHGGMHGMPGGHGGQGGMPGMMVMMNDDPMMMPPGAFMGMTGMHEEEFMHMEREMQHLHEMLEHAHMIIERQFEMIDECDLGPEEREELEDMAGHWFERMGDRGHGDHGHDHEEEHGHMDDGFLRQADSFVHKIDMSGEMAESLSRREALAVFGIWQAREHMSPEQRVELLTPIMSDMDLWPSVRNAASWVVMESLAEMQRETDAHKTLQDLIRSNGSKKMQ